MSRTSVRLWLFSKSCHGLYCLATTCTLREAYRQKLCAFNQSLVGSFVRLVDATWPCDCPGTVCDVGNRFCTTFVWPSTGHSAKLFGGSSSPCLSSPSFPCAKRRNWENCGMRALSDLAGQDPCQQLGSPVPAPKASKACSLLERFARTRFIWIDMLLDKHGQANLQTYLDLMNLLLGIFLFLNRLKSLESLIWWFTSATLERKSEATLDP